MIRTSRPSVTASLRLFASVVLAIGVAGPAAADIPPSFSSVSDVHGANDVVSAGTDLTQFGRDGSQAGVFKLYWSWDSTSSWTGAGQTGNACALFDTDNDTNIDYVVCAAIENPMGNAAMVAQSAGSPYAFSCANATNNRCASPVAVTIPAGAIASGELTADTPSPSPPANLITDTDPFPNLDPDQDWPDDSTIGLAIDRDFLPAGAVLANVCSYPSAANGGANNPYDCIVEPGTQLTTTTTPTTTSSTTSSTTTTTDTTTTTLVGPACPPAPQPSCEQGATGLVKIGAAGAPKDKLKWKVTATPSSEPANFGDPVGGTPSYDLCLYDSGDLRFSATVTTGEGTAWLPTASGYKLSDKTGAPDGITKMKLRTTAKAPRIDVKGAGANLTAPQPPFTGSVTVQLFVRDAAGERCWSTQFSEPITNDESSYKAKLD